ncbi:MAG: hypothetical protein AB7G23_08455 [Vicinamibacterales bacterium]
MQQRRPRLGDTVDDYCPRERRLTNHAVVAMVGDDVKQTRCSTCDTEHEYKHGQTPSARRRKEVAAGAVAPSPRRRQAVAPPGADAEEPEVAVDPDTEIDADAVLPDLVEAETVLTVLASDADLDIEPDDRVAEDEGPVHRRLIRATLPRPEGQVPERREPDFTVRQPGGRQGGEPDGNKTGARRRRGRRSGRPPGAAAGTPAAHQAHAQRREGNHAGGGGRPQGQRGQGFDSGRKRGR